MRTIRFAKAGAVVGIILLAGAFLSNYAHRTCIRTIQHKRVALETIFRHRLVSGTDRNRVIEVLDSEGIQHSGYEVAGDSPVLADVLGAPAVIEAQVPVGTWCVTRWSVHFVFR